MLINELIPDYRQPGCKTGNVFMTGNPVMGAADCFEKLINNSIGERIPVFLFHNYFSAEKKRLLLSLARSCGSDCVELNPGICSGASFDLFSLYGTPTEKAEALYAFFADTGDSADTVRLICRYWQDCILVLESRRTSYSVKNVLQMRVEEVRSGMYDCRGLSDEELDDELSFLDTHEVAHCWGVINDRASKLRPCGLIDLLSGAVPASVYFTLPRLYIVSSDAGSHDYGGLYASLANGFLSVTAAVCARKNAVRAPYRVFINDSAGLQPEQFASLLTVGTEVSALLPVCVYDQSVERSLRSHGESMLGYYGTFFIFNNMEGSFWSSFLGTSLMPDRTETYSRKKLTPLVISSATSGGVIARGGRQDALTIHRIEKPLYEARVFSALKEREFIYYNIFKNRKAKKQINW